MLFPYTYVPHQMEKMQAFIDFIFHEVWCKAPIGLVFSPDLFVKNSDLKEIIAEFGFSSKAAERGKSFYKDVKAIYNHFALLHPHEIFQFRQWYLDNNDLERICANDPTVHPARYIDVLAKYPILGKLLALFFRGLYDNSFLGLAAIREKIGDIKDHNKQFFDKNKAGKCPFCGISDLKGIFHTRREAYDHYLPKYRYPFNSINFRNLAPACHECNSTYKLSKDPAYNVAGRRKAFHPYAAPGYVVQIKVTLKHSDIEKLTPADITMQFGPTALVEEIDTWKDIYGIEERYKAKLCGENDGKYWLTQLLDECQAYGKQPADILNMRAQQAQSSPYADCNFLRKAFIDACHKAGVFN